ncbi:MAG: hypothetical protein AAGH53_07495 [Pseudomonadota bacterium]
MKTVLKSLPVWFFTSIGAATAVASEPIMVNSTEEAALLDGRCGGDEWDAATEIALSSDVSLLLMHDKNSLYICGKAKDGEPTAMDLYVENTETGKLHRIHLSAQMGESIYDGSEWIDSGAWELEDFAGFWTPFFGFQENENGGRPRFYRGSHKQVQILRKKFPGNSWKMRYNLAVGREGRWVEHHFPEDSVDSDTSTWTDFVFSE